MFSFVNFGEKLGPLSCLVLSLLVSMMLLGVVPASPTVSHTEYIVQNLENHFTEHLSSHQLQPINIVSSGIFANQISSVFSLMFVRVRLFNIVPWI